MMVTTTMVVVMVAMIAKSPAERGDAVKSKAATRRARSVLRGAAGASRPRIEKKGKKKEDGN